MHRHPFIATLAMLALGLASAGAASPSLSKVLPRGAKRGAEHLVEFHGERLGDCAEILFYSPGLTATSFEVVSPKLVRVKVAVAPGCELGEHYLRVRTKSGLSHLRSFWVGQFDNAAEVEPNNDFSAPQEIASPGVTLEGRLDNEDVDHYQIEAKKGQRISVEVEGIRLGDAFFDPYLAILDADRFELAVSDDTDLLLQDSTLSVTAPADGKYVIQVREASYTGNENCHYRLHVGAFPRPLVAFPPGGKTGTELPVKLIGDPAGDIDATVALPATPDPAVPIRSGGAGGLSPAPVVVRASDLENVLEAEPNNNMGAANRSPVPLPAALNGVIGADGDQDWFGFTAKKGQRLIFRAHAKSVRSPLDPVINIFGPDKKHIVGNDDADNRQDAKIDFTAPADGDYTIRIRDHLNKGGGRYVYRIEAEPPRPSLSLSIPHFARNDSQSRQMIYVPRGGRFATRVVATRSHFGGDLTFETPGLPTGARFVAQPMHGSINTFPLVFEAAPDAPLGAALIDLVGRGKAGDREIAGTFSQQVDFVTGNPNNTVYYHSSAAKLAVAVVEKLPFTIDVEPPAVPLVRNGTLSLKVVARREEGFTKAITLRNLWNPPGIGSQPTVAIPEGKDEAYYTLNANGDAALQTWHLAFMAESDAGAGQIVTGSALVPVTVAEPYLGMAIEMAAVEQGKPGTVLCKIEHHRPFEGTAKLRLLGLPGKVTAPEVDIDKGTGEVSFAITTAPDSPKGQHKNLFCHVRIPDAGGEIPHNIGHGGVLRIDPPPKKPATKPPEPAAEAKVAAAPAKKPLSRLEKLRQEAKKP